MKYCASIFILFTALTSSLYSQDTVQVKAGWNIIGSVKSGAVPDVLSTIPDSIITGSFFGFAPDSGYRSTGTLEKGVGYWVKVTSDGIIIFSTTPSIDSCKSKAFIYQGKFYNTVKIGNQCWMAENLDVGMMLMGTDMTTNNDTTEKYCYQNNPLNCVLYGGLYEWKEAMHHVTTEGTQGICPPGWHIPTLVEFQTLSSVVGGDGNALKAVGQGTGDGTGTNTSGFTALLAGRSFPNGSFSTLGGTLFWSSTVISGLMTGYQLHLDGSRGSIGPYDDYWGSRLSVRCLED